jgi:hypothetical protein
MILQLREAIVNVQHSVDPVLELLEFGVVWYPFHVGALFLQALLLAVLEYQRLDDALQEGVLNLVLVLSFFKLFLFPLEVVVHLFDLFIELNDFIRGRIEVSLFEVECCR